MFRVFVNVPAAVGALAGGLVAAEVAGRVVDVSAAAGFSGAEWLSIFVIWAATDRFDVDWLFTSSNTALGSGSRLFAKKRSFFVDWIVKIGEKVWWNADLGKTRRVSVKESFEFLRRSIGSEADFFWKSDGIVSLVVENFGDE